MGFKFETLRETEKAILANIPYYEATNEHKKAHKQMFFECWIPKIVIEKGTAKDFVTRKREEIRCRNSYQRKFAAMPKSYETLGEYAPIKTPVRIEVVDEDKLAYTRKAMIEAIEERYGGTLLQLLNDEVGTKGEVSDEDMNTIRDLYLRKLPNVPNKQITIYK